MNIPKDLRYTTEHEWVRKEGDVVTIGITDYAQQLLGDVVYVEMPDTGAEISKGDAFGVVESVKAASDIFAPISGSVVDIHHELDEHPEYINQSPYERGWIVKVKPSQAGELDTLLDPEGYQALVQKESEQG
jgi:glycine cleavage system H protein